MDKKNSLSRKVSRVYRIHRLILLSLFSIVIVFAESRKAVTDIETYFSDLDKALSALGEEVTKKDAAQAKEPLEKMLKDYPGMEFLIWTNSEGVVVNEADRDGKPGKPGRNLSRQRWFKTIINLEPYYGSLRTRKGDHQLFWCKPIRKSESGKDSFGGAIVTRIDLKRSFDAIAKKIGTPFRILLKGEPLFSHAWDATYDSTAISLTIKGIDDIQANAKKVKPVVKATPPPEPVEEKKEASIFSTNTIIVLVAVLIVLIILVSIFKAAIRKRQEALMREIEGDESFETDKPFEKVKEFDEAKEKKVIEEVKTTKEVLPEKKEEKSPKETKVKKPPDKKRKSIFEPEERTVKVKSTAKETPEPAKPEELPEVEEKSSAKEATELAKPEEFPEVEEKKEVKPDQPDQPKHIKKAETPPSKKDPLILDIVPEETQVLRAEFAEAIKDIKPGEIIDEPASAAEETEDSIPSNIMEKVQALLRKHVHSVLEERAKQIEEDVLNRVRDELSGEMKEKEE